MKKKMWFVLCIMTSVLLTTACGEKKEPGEEKRNSCADRNNHADRNSRADRNRI